MPLGPYVFELQRSPKNVVVHPQKHIFCWMVLPVLEVRSQHLVCLVLELANLLLREAFQCCFSGQT